MKQLTEEHIREAFRAGSEWGAHKQAGNYYNAPLDEDEYVETIFPKSKGVELIPITYGIIKNTVGWSRFCDVTGNNAYAINEFGDFEYDTIFKITKEEASKLGFVLDI